MNDEELAAWLKEHFAITDPNTQLGPAVTLTWAQLAKGVDLAIMDNGTIEVREIEKES